MEIRLNFFSWQFFCTKIRILYCKIVSHGNTVNVGCLHAKACKHVCVFWKFSVASKFKKNGQVFFKILENLLESNFYFVTFTAI